MEGVGHLLHLEKPEQFNAILSEFVQRNVVSAAARP